MSFNPSSRIIPRDVRLLQVPCLDLSLPEHALSAQLRKACTDTGFFYGDRLHLVATWLPVELDTEGFVGGGFFLYSLVLIYEFQLQLLITASRRI